MEDNGEKMSLRGKLSAYEEVLIHLLAYLPETEYETSKLLLHREAFPSQKGERVGTEFFRSAKVEALRELFSEADEERQTLRSGER